MEVGMRDAKNEGRIPDEEQINGEENEDSDKLRIQFAGSRILQFIKLCENLFFYK
jgi:hypothetical protein